jgi:hypothetical protein
MHYAQMSLFQPGKVTERQEPFETSGLRLERSAALELLKRLERLFVVDTSAPPE